MKKNIKKIVKPTYIVDITDCNTVEDFALAFALAKHNAGQPLTDDNLYSICNTVANIVADVLTENACSFIRAISICNIVKPKKPWYKRFWNWLIGRK